VNIAIAELCPQTIGIPRASGTPAANAQYHIALR
jgi:hypothetical protein